MSHGLGFQSEGWGVGFHKFCICLYMYEKHIGFIEGGYEVIERRCAGSREAQEGWTFAPSPVPLIYAYLNETREGFHGLPYLLPNVSCMGPTFCRS